MVQFTLPKNSKVEQGKTWPHAAKTSAEREYPHLPLEPG